MPRVPELLLVTDRRTARRPLAEAVERALAGGVDGVLLREKDLATAELVPLGAGVRDACRRAGAVFLVAHDPEAAAELGADGVHLGYSSPGVAEARRRLGPGRLAGRSTHGPDELRRALEEGADYVTFGPVYDTPSKRGLLEPRGVAAVAAAVAAARPVPVLALGGVAAARIAELRRAGVAGVAFLGAVLAQPDETAAARALRAAWRA